MYLLLNNIIKGNNFKLEIIIFFLLFKRIEGNIKSKNRNIWCKIYCS